MTYEVRWLRRALADLQAQAEYIARHNPPAARRLAADIRRFGDGLSELPAGRPGRMAGTYEKLVPGRPYIVAYRIRRSGGTGTIEILRIIHTARDWRAGRWPE